MPRMIEDEESPAGHHREPLAFRATPYRWRDPATLPPMPWLYGYELQRGLVSLLVATTGVGKSTFEIGNVLAMVTGRALMGRRLWGDPLRVWYWNLEDDRDHLDRQIGAACLHWSISPEDIGKRLFIDSADEAEPLKIAITTPNGATIQRPVVDAMIAELIGRRIDVLILDPFVASHSTAENDNGAMDMVVKEWAKVARAANCAIRLVSHTRKLGGVSADIEATRGGGSLAAGARSGVVLNKMTSAEAEGMGVSDYRRFFRASDDKPNRASPPPEKAEWFELHSIDLGNATPDRPADLIGVAAPWSPPDPFSNVTVDHLRCVQAKIAEGQWRKDHQSPDWAGRAVADVLGLDLDRKEDRRCARELLKTWIENHTLKVIDVPDDKNRPRPHIVVDQWVVGD